MHIDNRALHFFFSMKELNVLFSQICERHHQVYFEEVYNTDYCLFPLLSVYKRKKGTYSVPLKSISSAFFRQVRLTNPSQFLQFFRMGTSDKPPKEASASIYILYTNSI